MRVCDMAESLFGFANQEVDGSCWMFDGQNSPELISTGRWKNTNKQFEVNTYKRRSYDMNKVDRVQDFGHPKGENFIRLVQSDLSCLFFIRIRQLMTALFTTMPQCFCVQQSGCLTFVPIALLISLEYQSDSQDIL